MLVLSRSTHQSIVLPELNVTIQVLGDGNGSVRLGIKAPPDILVLRQELVGKTPKASPPSSVELTG